MFVHTSFCYVEMERLFFRSKIPKCVAHSGVLATDKNTNTGWGWRLEVIVLTNCPTHLEHNISFRCRISFAFEPEQGTVFVQTEVAFLPFTADHSLWKETKGQWPNLKCIILCNFFLFLFCFVLFFFFLAFLYLASLWLSVFNKAQRTKAGHPTMLHWAELLWKHVILVKRLLCKATETYCWTFSRNLLLELANSSETTTSVNICAKVDHEKKGMAWHFSRTQMTTQEAGDRKKVRYCLPSVAERSKAPVYR